LIYNIFIISEDGIPTITYSNGTTHGNKKKNIMKLTDSLCHFANDFHTSLKRFEMGEKRYFYTIDDATGAKYIFETDVKISNRRVNFILDKIKQLYNEYFSEVSTKQKSEIGAMVGKIEHEIKQLLKNKDLTTEDFLKKV